MEKGKVLTIIKRLADGIDPYSGELFPTDSPYQNPDTVRALYEAIKILERSQKKAKNSREMPKNAGAAWTQEEEQLLITGYDAGASIIDLAEKHERTEAAIQARLVKLGKIQLP
jgi:hypothetical protein